MDIFLAHKIPSIWCVKKFLALVKNQFPQSISILHSGSGDISLTCLPIISPRQGNIVSEYFPYTPQQNGVAEAWKKHLLDVVRYWLLQSAIPSIFWAKLSWLLYVSLINFIFQIVASISIFSPPWCHHPQYDHLRIFSCLCFVHLPSPNHTKFLAQSTCAFLQCASNKKVFLYYDPLVSPIRTTDNVAFVNLIFFSQQEGLNFLPFQFLRLLLNHMVLIRFCS